MSAILRRRRGRIATAWALALILAPQIVCAQTTAAQAPESPRQNKASPQTDGAKPPSNTVSGVTVTISREIPKVVSTYPGQGAAIAPGILIIRISYDTRMQGQSWSYVSSRDGEPPPK